jgi:uncharacterized membrane protein YkoI
MMRTLGLVVAATLFTTACSNAGVTTAEPRAKMTTKMTAQITEPEVAITVAAIGSGTIALEEDSPGLSERARVSDANARVNALQRVPGGRIVEAELEEEHGRLVYSYEIRVADGRGTVEIDARTGAVLSERRKEGDDGRGAREDQEPGRVSDAGAKRVHQPDKGRRPARRPIAD